VFKVFDVLFSFGLWSIKQVCPADSYEVADMVLREKDLEILPLNATWLG